MARRNATRKGRKGLVQRVWSPFGHVVNATGNSIGEVASTAGNVTKRTLKGATKLGNIWTSHANMAVKNLLGKRKGGSKASRRNGAAMRKTRKSRR